MQPNFSKQLLVSYKNILLLLLGSIFFAACSETTAELKPEAQTMQYLTGSGNRYWRLKEIYVNNVKITLTASQLTYYKTYTRIGDIESYSGTFVDADGFRGTWALKAKDKITETITNATNGTVPLEITIKLLDKNNMDVEYPSNGQTVRTVYFGY